VSGWVRTVWIVDEMEESVVALESAFVAQQLTSNQELKRTLDCNLLSLPLQSAAVKRRLARCYVPSILQHRHET